MPSRTRLTHILALGQWYKWEFGSPFVLMAGSSLHSNGFCHRPVFVILNPLYVSPFPFFLNQLVSHPREELISAEPATLLD